MKSESAFIVLALCLSSSFIVCSKGASSNCSASGIFSSASNPEDKNASLVDGQSASTNHYSIAPYDDYNLCYYYTYDMVAHQLVQSSFVPSTSYFVHSGGNPSGLSTSSSFTSIGNNREFVSSTASYPFTSSLYCESDFRFYYSSYGEYVDRYYRGTTFFVNPYVAITAAHCVFFDASINGYDDSINDPIFTNYFAVNAYISGSFIWEYAQSVTIDSRYFSSQSMDFDWAVVRFSEPIGNYVGWYPVKANPLAAPNPIFVSDSVHTVGFPSDRGDQETLSEGSVTSLSSPFLNSNMYIVGGNSGGPILDSDGYAIGIVTRYYNDTHYGFGPMLDGENYSLLMR